MYGLKHNMGILYSSRMNIINDMLTITNASREQIQVKGSENLNNYTVCKLTLCEIMNCVHFLSPQKCTCSFNLYPGLTVQYCFICKTVSYHGYYCLLLLI